MGKRWWVGLVVLSFLTTLFIVLVAPRVAASCTYCNGGVCNGICESGETSYCDDCNKLFCSGDRICDAGLGENCNTCPTDCGYCDGHSCTSGGQCQGRYCVCGLCVSSPPPTGHCCSDADCPSDANGTWSTPYCGTDGNVYHSRTLYDHFCNANSQCDLSTSTDVALVQTCTSGCSAGSCTTCTPHDHLGCAAPDIYWFDSCNNQQDLYDQCGTHNTVGAWGSNYCGADGNVYHNHTKTYYGCTTGDTACRVTNTEVVPEQVQACTNGCTAGACNPGCSDAAACVVHTNTGCSLDYVNRWWCAPNASIGGCYEQAYETCTAGHCDAATHQCVSGCTSDAACDDNNACTSDACTQSTGACSHANLPTTTTCTTPQGQAGHCDGQGTCIADTGCTPTCTVSGATQCAGANVQTCGTGSGGCLAWATTQTCNSPGSSTPYCALLDTVASCVQCTTTSQCSPGFSCDAAGSCVATPAQCTDECAAGSSGCSADASTPWTCGHTAADTCLHRVNSSACPDWQACNDGRCTDASVAITPGSAGTVVAGSWFTLPFTLSHESTSYLLQAPAWPAQSAKSDAPGARSVSGLPTNSDVGVRTVTLVLHRVTPLGDTVVSQTSVNVNVACNPADASVGACCDAGSGSYKAEGAACSYSLTETGTCTAAHTCRLST